MSEPMSDGWLAEIRQCASLYDHYEPDSPDLMQAHREELLAEVERLRAECAVKQEVVSRTVRISRGLADEVDRLRAELDACRRRCEGHCERIAEQSELLSRRAEKGPTGCT